MKIRSRDLEEANDKLNEITLGTKLEFRAKAPASSGSKPTKETATKKTRKEVQSYEDK